MNNKILYFKSSTLNLTRTQVVERLAQIDAIIDALLVATLTSGGLGGKVEYELDTGQSKQRVTYNTPDDIAKALVRFNTLRDMYARKCSKRIIKLTDKKNFRI